MYQVINKMIILELRAFKKIILLNSRLFAIFKLTSANFETGLTRLKSDF